MVNDPQQDLMELIRQADEEAVKQRSFAIHIEPVCTVNVDCDETFKLYVYVSGHKLWDKGLNPKHNRAHCTECNGPKKPVR